MIAALDSIPDNAPTEMVEALKTSEIEVVE